MSQFSARIRAARAFAGLTQAELASRLGIDEQTVKRREHPGGNEPKKGELIAIAAICGVSLEYLTGDADLPDPAGQVSDLDQMRADITELRRGLATLAADVLRHTGEIRELRDTGRRSGRPEGNEL